MITEEARRLLEAEREAALSRLRSLTATRADVVAAAAGANTDDEHDPEGATIGFERAQVSALIDRTERHLMDVDTALARVAAGAYGRCDRCGEPIEAGRLAARPTSTTCVGCARRGTPR